MKLRNYSIVAEGRCSYVSAVTADNQQVTPPTYFVDSFIVKENIDDMGMSEHSVMPI